MSFFAYLKEIFLPINRRALKKEITKEAKEIKDLISDITQHNQQIGHYLHLALKKMSMQDNIWQIGDVRFFVPNYPLDLIQHVIVDHNNFFEHDILEDLSQFMPKNPVICDIGSNIGNHALYWLSKDRANYVYCFEPRPETFQILKKNIDINHFNDHAECYEIALSDKEKKISTGIFDQKNIGANRYSENVLGDIKANSLDSLNLSKKIDFIKIDVEGMEEGVLKGAQKTIQNNLPIIFIEIFPENYDKIFAILGDMGYSMKKEFRSCNYLFMPISTELNS